MPFRTFLGAIALLMVSAASALAGEYLVEFRPVLSPEEAKAVSSEIIEVNGERLHIHALPSIADRDIEKVETFRSMNRPGRLLVGFIFNENGLRRFHRLLLKFREKRVAIFSEGNLLAVSPVLPPEFTSERVVIGWEGSEGDLRGFAARVNKKPPGIMALYIEEQIRYQNTAADMWADVYGNIEQYVSSKTAQRQSDWSLVDNAKDE